MASTIWRGGPHSHAFCSMPSRNVGTRAGAPGRPWGTPGAPARVPTLREGIEQKAWLCGPPRQIVEAIREFEARYPGLDQVMLHWPEGVPAREYQDQLRRFAREVMPALRR